MKAASPGIARGLRLSSLAVACTLSIAGEARASLLQLGGASARFDGGIAYLDDSNATQTDAANAAVPALYCHLALGEKQHLGFASSRPFGSSMEYDIDVAGHRGRAKTALRASFDYDMDANVVALGFRWKF